MNTFPPRHHPVRDARPDHDPYNAAVRGAQHLPQGTPHAPPRGRILPGAGSAYPQPRAGVLLGGRHGQGGERGSAASESMAVRGLGTWTRLRLSHAEGT